MRSLSRTGLSGPSHTASRHDAGSVSPATLRIVQEADATMTPDGWGADYTAPASGEPFRAGEPTTLPVNFLSLSGL